MGWFTKSIIAVICVVPAWLSIGFFEKNYNLHAGVIFLWYTAGMVLGSLVGLPMFCGISGKALMPSVSVLGIMLIGAVLGTTANMILFSVLSTAPNPGLPIAISGTSSIFVTLLSALLGVVFPLYFKEVELNIHHVGGVLLTIIGLYLMALPK